MPTATPSPLRRIQLVTIPSTDQDRSVEFYEKLGFVASLNLNPQKARVLLRLALLKQRTNQDLQRLFDQY